MGLIVSNALPSGYQGLSLEANPSSLISAAGGWMNAANGSACHVSWTSVFPVGSGIYKPQCLMGTPQGTQPWAPSTPLLFPIPRQLLFH